jgi:outer membrane protein TolC
MVPAVYRLPAAYDLRTVLALVAAHNPAINRRRALLAASLIEARRLGVARLPDPSWGAAYAPADGRFGQGLVTGDCLAESLACGQFGLVQPLLDGGRMPPLDGAGALRAGIAHDVLLDEINLRLAEAAELYYQARALEASGQIHVQLLENARRRESYVGTLHERGEALAVDQLETRQAVAQAEADLALDRQRLDYQRARLRELCNLPAGSELPFTADSFQAEMVGAPDFQELRQLALLNHPRLRAARRALVAAFADAAASDRARPESFLSLAQGQSRRPATDPLDDYVARSLSGRLPSADSPDRAQGAQHWQAVREAMRLDEEEQTQAVTGMLDSALIEFQRSREALRVRQADLTATLERVRLARLRSSLGPVDEAKPVSPLDLIQAHHAFYRGLLAMQAARTDAAVLHARMWREVGLAGQLTERCVAGDSARISRAASAVWVRSSRALIADDGAIARFLDQAARQRLRRVYLDLEPDARLLAEQESSERLALFIQRCAAGGLEVWGLMGGAGWLDEGAEKDLSAGVRRIAEYQRRFAPLEPRLAGLKLDLAPQAQPGWADDARRRDDLDRRFLALLRAARDSLPAELPLWLDCPVDFFRAEHAPLLGALVPLLDGITVQCASDRPAWIQARADEALATWPKALEVGLELSPTAPTGETLARWQDAELQALRRHLVERFADHPRFAGLALHDPAGLESQPRP